MNKAILTVIVVTVLLCSFKTKAQDKTAFDKGTLVVTAGYGIPDLERLSLRVVYAGYTGVSVAGVGPILLKADYGLMKFKWGHTLGVGGVVGISTTNVSYNYVDANYTTQYYNNTYVQTYSSTNIIIGVSGTYHILTKEKLDCYARVGLGGIINIASQSTTDPNGSASNAVLPHYPGVYEALTFGIRYYFTKNIGVYAEGGWDAHSIVQGGLAVKF